MITRFVCGACLPGFLYFCWLLIGPEEPVLFYTNNITGDTPFLCIAFPSLIVDVLPISQWGTHPPLSYLFFPSLPTVLDSPSAVHSHCCHHLRDQFREPSLMVGIDINWSVELEHHSMGFVTRGTQCQDTAIIQIAWKTEVFIIQVNL